ncbi:NAD(P)-dependent oxidoreductase [Microbacterium sp.]|uniref:NAD(P)-dependent oxidoreductase n=1 Tax=Microbacterium sp. TaxID=51671 RepID=UPI0025D003DF|nr:NAD(P)-dependent oxidoreductase [Microbacterium sp.]
MSTSPSPRPVVLVTSRSFGSGNRDLVAELADAGYDVVRASPAHDLAELVAVLPRAVGWIAGTGPVTAAALEGAPNLKIVARYGVGIDAVDMDAADALGIVVTNTPGANSAAVVEHTIALLLAALRGIPAADRRVRAGDWSGWTARELSALTVGIVGLGRIGRGVATRLAVFGCEILGHDPWVAPDDDIFRVVRRVEADEIPRLSDVVTLHVPGGSRLVDDAWLAMGDRELFLVNTARADLVDEAAVVRALESRRLSAYAADSLATENHGTDSPLLAPRLADRVIITPHLGAQTREGIDGMGVMATDDLLAVLAGDSPRFAVHAAARP